MFKDPIVEEVRATRQRHSARFNHDLKSLGTGSQCGVLHLKCSAKQFSIGILWDRDSC